MAQADLGPEFANAPCDAVSVVVKIVAGVKGDDVRFGSGGEPLEIESLSADDGVEDGLDRSSVWRGGRVEEGDGAIDLTQQGVLGFVALRLGERHQVERGGVGAGYAGGEGLQGMETFADGQAIGVGDGIARSGEQVSEPDLRPHASGEDMEREEERARNALEQRFEPSRLGACEHSR